MMSLGRGDEGVERTVWVCGDLHKRNAYKSNLEKLTGAIYSDSHWFKFHLLYFPEKARKNKSIFIYLNTIYFIEIKW